MKTLTESVAAPSIHYRSRIIYEAREMANVLYATDLAVEFLGNSTGPAYLDQYQSSSGWSLNVGHAGFTAQVQGTLSIEHITLHLISRAAGATLWGNAVYDGMIVSMPPGSEIHGSVTPGYSWAVVMIPITLCEAVIDKMGRNHAGKVKKKILYSICTEKELSLLTHSLKGVMETLALMSTSSIVPVPPDTVLLELVDLLLDCLSPGDDADWPLQISISNRFHIARKADHWMRERLEYCFSITDICAALRVSRRELEYAFRNTFKTSPQKHAQILRLNAVRRHLLHPLSVNDNVTKAASRFGFRHLGRFSANYFGLFQELPSATLMRAKIQPR